MTPHGLEISRNGNLLTLRQDSVHVLDVVSYPVFKTTCLVAEARTSSAELESSKIQNMQNVRNVNQKRRCLIKKNEDWKKKIIKYKRT